jgi:hypothetical protein
MHAGGSGNSGTHRSGGGIDGDGGGGGDGEGEKQLEQLVVQTRSSSRGRRKAAHKRPAGRARSVAFNLPEDKQPRRSR